MEWRQQTSVSCADAFNEAQRWIEEVTGKLFGCKDFRAALENGVLLCDLINQLKPAIIKRVNRLSTPIAGLDNVNLFLKACGKLGLNVSQLFHPGDLQDLSTRATLRKDESNRRLKNVLITIYWLGRKAHVDAFYSGPQLNFKAFEGLLGLALSKALDEGSNVFVKDSWYPERSDCLHRRRSYKLGNSVDGMDSVDSRTLHPTSEGCGSDPEAEQVFKMEANQSSTRQDKGCIAPPALHRKQGVAENGMGGTSPLARAYDIQVRPKNAQVNPGWIWSKSLSDIPMVYPVRKVPDGNIIYVDQDKGIAREWNQENKNECMVSAKDSEAQWQDDLTKWKNRRRSTKSDLHRKSQEREHVINQMINGAMHNSERNETGGLLKSRDQQSPRKNYPATCPSSTSPSKSSSADLKPRTRVLLARSFALEVSFIPTAQLGSNNSAQTWATTAAAMPASDGNILGEETHYALLPSDKAGATKPTVACPFTAQTRVKAQGGGPTLPQPTRLARPKQISTLITTIQPNGITKSASSSSHREPDIGIDPKAKTFCLYAVNKVGVGTVKERKNHKEKNQKTSLEPAVDQGRTQQAARVYKDMSRSGSWSSSASLPRGYRRSEGSVCLSSPITARPFGTKQSRVSSLPRLWNLDENQGLLLKGDKVEPLSPPIKSSLKRQTATAQLKGQNQPSIRQSANQAKQNGKHKAEEGNDVSVSSQTSCQTDGFLHQPFTQTHLVLQPYPFRQAQHNRTASLPSNASVDHIKLDHSDMRVSLTLKPNSRPDFGFQTHWDHTGVRVKFIQTGSPAELCQLCVDDAIMTVNGVAVEHMNYTQWKDKMTSSLITGSLTMDIRRYGNKDWNTSEGFHHNQPGKSRKMLNLTAAAPVLKGYPDHHANRGTSPEITLRKMSTIIGQIDHVMQGKVMHGELAENHSTARSKGCDSVSGKNQKRRAEFFRQKGGSESAISDLQMPSFSPSSFSWSWDHEGDRRRQEKWQEEQERLLQEQFQRDQERLDAEWQRAQRDAVGESCIESGRSTFDRTNGDECPVGALIQKCKTGEKEQRAARDGLKVPGSKPQSNGQSVKKDTTTVRAWADDCGGFAQLSPAHRAKSMSTPALAAPQKPRGEERNRRHTLSKVEKERQQILEEMKKRTQLLTDNSWIRQRSSSLHKEPIYVGVPLKRFDSLDNLDTLRQSPLWTTTFSYPRPNSVAGGCCAPGRNPLSRWSTGGILSQRNASMDPSHHCSVWAANNVSEELKLERGFGLETGSHTVSPAQTQVHCGLHETCVLFTR